MRSEGEQARRYIGSPPSNGMYGYVVLHDVTMRYIGDNTHRVAARLTTQKKVSLQNTKNATSSATPRVLILPSPSSYKSSGPALNKIRLAARPTLLLD